MMKLLKYKASGFTLVEMMTIILISSVSFLGMFYIYGDVSKKLEGDLARSEVKTYCNYALNEMANYIKMADDISFNIYDQNIQLITDGNYYGRNSFSLSSDDGILKNGDPIHNSTTRDPNNPTRFVRNHVIRYTSIEKNQFTRYKIRDWDIYSKPNVDGTTTNENSDVRKATLIVEMVVDIIMGWDEDIIIETLSFKKETFSPTAFIKYRNS
ncbi:MAG: prepilin-type N-terminal cleavage/methylation domain-containing protein [Candidatus Marinimicrobia bacterium]|nr:prepilin-type N-terminal cleavage/methylation domain-containing protein [Candidatus Neomarinimicrobiota bacterium]